MVTARKPRAVPTATKPKKMKWAAPSPALVERFERALRRYPEAQTRKMFGYPAAFVHGNMLAGLFEDSLMLRLSAGDLTRFWKECGAKSFEPMPGRVMREYAVVPRAIVESDAELAKWLGDAFRYVSALPEKAVKPRSPK
jgi:TfoX/Sxy family transcriptional regulator of competence genes